MIIDTTIFYCVLILIVKEINYQHPTGTTDRYRFTL